MSRKKGNDVHIRMSLALKTRLNMVCALRREASTGSYVRRAIEQTIERDMRDFPNFRLIARPNEVVYNVEGEGKQRRFIPITRTIGGERVWILDNVGYMPHATKERWGYLVDLTVEPGQQGTNGRNVVIASEAVIGLGEQERSVPSVPSVPPCVPPKS